MDDAALTNLLCGLLSTIPGWSWRPDGPAYNSTEVGIYYGAIGASPDQAVGVRVYTTLDNTAEHWAARRAQLKFRGGRGAPDGADKLAALAFERLQGLSRSGGISGISRASMAPLGADQNGREERSDNYEILLDNPEVTQS